MKLFSSLQLKICAAIILSQFSFLSAVENTRNSEEIFTPFFGIREIPKEESLSGVGSNLENTTVLRKELPKLLEDLGCEVMLDLPCGDFYWMRKVDLPVNLYIGADCIGGLIARHNIQYKNSNRIFIQLDALVQDIPKADLVLCRDMLIHFSNKDIFTFFRNLKKSGSKYLLTTHFTSFRPNVDIKTPGARTLNFTLPPFNFPQPLRVITENYKDQNGEIFDRSLALWEIDSLPINDE